MNITNTQLVIIGGAIILLTIIFILSITLLKNKKRTTNQKNAMWNQLKNLSPDVLKNRLIEIIINDGVEGCNIYQTSSGNETEQFAKQFVDNLSKFMDIKEIAHIYIYKLAHNFGEFRNAEYLGDDYDERVIFNSIKDAYKNCIRL